ncbi:MAG TPA: dihydropteroate synthase [Gemmatimonadales bacterium]
MKLTALASAAPDAVRAALAARGWDADPAAFAAAGLEPLVVLLEQISEPEREALVHWAARTGADVLTGEGWALIAAAASRLAPLARPDRAPPELAGLGPELARFLAAHADPVRAWQVRDAEIALAAPVILGIVNVTPDSFSDGGQFASTGAAVAQAERLAVEGAQIVDIGGESTRPGAGVVPVEAEIARVAPVVAAAAKRGIRVSVDTRKAAVARAALDAGALIVNDVSGLGFDPEMARTVAEAKAGLVLMHMRGTPDTMDALAQYRQVAVEVADELRRGVDTAAGAGVERERIVVDPGLGFAKTPAQNWRLLDELATIAGLGYPVLVGPSRKRFLGAATGATVADRDRATAVACALAWERGARLFRVHHVALAREALSVAAATRPIP